MRTGWRTSSSLIIAVLYSWFFQRMQSHLAPRETAVMFSSQFTAGVFHVSLKSVSRTLRSPQFSFLLHKNKSHTFSLLTTYATFFLITFYALLLTTWVTCDDDVLDTFFFPSWELDTCLQTDFSLFHIVIIITSVIIKLCGFSQSRKWSDCFTRVSRWLPQRVSSGQRC